MVSQLPSPRLDTNSTTISAAADQIKGLTAAVGSTTSSTGQQQQQQRCSYSAKGTAEAQPTKKASGTTLNATAAT
jgi:hypothetical protein